MGGALFRSSSCRSMWTIIQKRVARVCPHHGIRSQASLSGLVVIVEEDAVTSGLEFATLVVVAASVVHDVFVYRHRLRNRACVRLLGTGCTGPDARRKLSEAARDAGPSSAVRREPLLR